jgi:hypothetical protein
MQYLFALNQMVLASLWEIFMMFQTVQIPSEEFLKAFPILSNLVTNFSGGC